MTSLMQADGQIGDDGFILRVVILRVEVGWRSFSLAISPGRPEADLLFQAFHLRGFATH